MGEIKEVKATEILPKKDGKRVLVYPACRKDRDWINFFDPDFFVGIDLGKLKEDDFKNWGNNPELRLYGETDAINPPEIPKADEVVLLLKHFFLIGWSGDTRLSGFTEETWKEYQQKNLICLREYLKTCERSALKRVFVVDFHGYDSIIIPHGYRKLISSTRSVDCGEVYVWCNSRPCDKAPPLFSWEEVKKSTGYLCGVGEGTTILGYNRNFPVPTLITYVKEK